MKTAPRCVSPPNKPHTTPPAPTRFGLSDFAVLLIYLSRFYDVTTSDDKIQTIVHELAHFVGPASGNNERVTDYAYGDVTSANMTALSSFKKIHNAECYGNFAFEAQFGRQPLHKT